MRGDLGPRLSDAHLDESRLPVAHGERSFFFELGYDLYEKRRNRPHGRLTEAFLPSLPRCFHRFSPPLHQGGRLVAPMASGSMFSVSLSDRLKAAVNTLDAAGTALQARAIGQPSRDGPSRPLALSVPPSSFPTISTSPTFANNLDSAQPDSPTRTMSGHYVASTSALAENALSGLRKSFSFGGRPSVDGHRPSASVMQPAGLQELKDIPSTPTATTAQASGSRPTSPAPARFLNPSNFELGSDPSSMTATPQQRRSPAPTHVNLVSRSPRSPAPRAVPTPDPSDPATFPLPPSPSLSPSPLLSASFATYSDPLGASPLLDSHENADPPALGLQSPTPVAEITLDAVGLVVQGVDVEASPEPPVKEEEEANGSEEVSSPVENGRPPEIDGQAEQKLAAAERRYEGASGLCCILHSDD